MKSKIADVKNIGNRTAGTITAAAFLQEFVDYDWAHLDIAGTAWITSPMKYFNIGATGSGVRVVTQFLSDYQGK